MEEEKRDNASTPPFSSLPLGSKVAIIILLAGWGLTYLIGGYYGILSFIQMLRQLIIFDPEIIVYGIQYCFYALQGAILLVLLLDYITSPSILRRHRVELTILLGLKIIKDLTFVFANFSMQTVLSGIFTWVWISLILILPTMTESLLSLYLIKRLISGKAVLTKWTFLLALTVFVALFARIFLSPLINLFQFSNPIPFLSPKDIILGLAYYGTLALVAIFCIRTFMALRRGGEFELVLPRYLRISVIFYALVYSVSEAWNSFISANLAFSFNLGKAVLIVLGLWFYVGLIAVCVFPPRFMVGEKIFSET